VRGSVVSVHLTGCRYTTNGFVYSTYSADEMDAVAAYCGELDEIYLLPIELVAGRRAIQLRVAPTKNAQRAAINWAADYKFSGAVAQLGERRYGIPEAGGSSPPSSINGCLLRLTR
jgi:hypothetical protein